jgi:hypothetical protein
MRDLLVSHPRGNLPRIQNIEFKKCFFITSTQSSMEVDPGLHKCLYLKSLLLTVSTTVLFCQNSKNREFSTVAQFPEPEVTLTNDI